MGSDRGDVSALDAVTGQVVWVHLGGNVVRRSLWGSGDQIYFTDDSGFHALSRENGVEKWCFARDASFIARRPEAVYVSLGERTVVALDPETGDVLREVRMPADAKFPANMTDGLFYMITRAGYVFVVDLPL